MRFRFRRRDDFRLYADGKGKEDYPPGVFRAFVRVMDLIRASRDERDLRAMKALNFKKLKGDTEGKRTLRLNEQYRLIVATEKDDEGKFLFIHAIDKHTY